MSKIGLLLVLSLLWVTVGCSDHPTQADEANGHTPTEIAVRYLTADIQKNIRRQMELATSTLQESLKESTEDQYEYFSAYKLQFGPENKSQLDKNYQLEEFKLNETTYFCRFSGTYKSEDI
ncbi:hypothetical protein [Shimazuella alba]|uniref:Lipoprotein n=1 Tax=Shimazuella alba TaxID=2690964 RepID=A0A6I4VPZ1_9BACL|nr:hypothetical protein [Shimazuella alba]MXQ52345.1 hypothetical protein [Shimazuella alba]